VTTRIAAFSAQWATAFLHAVNADVNYRDAGRRWNNPVALVVNPGPQFPIGAAVQVDLNAGRALEAHAVVPTEVSAPFVLTGDLATWKEIVTGAMDPLLAVARGRVTLAKGSITTLLMHAKAAKTLVACAQQIDTEWPA
jgi:putative sterol carrier protein